MWKACSPEDCLAILSSWSVMVLNLGKVMVLLVVCMTLLAMHTAKEDPALHFSL